MVAWLELTGVVGTLPGPDGLVLLYALQETAGSSRAGVPGHRSRRPHRRGPLAVSPGGPVDQLTTAGGLVVIGTSAAYGLPRAP